MLSKTALFYCCILLIAIPFISCNHSGDVFEKLSASKTNIQFANNLEKRKAFGILYYLYYYNGGGVATGDINNDGLTDIYFTANSNGNNKLYLNKGDFEFEDITEKAGVFGKSDWCTGVTMADVNGDGYLDIYVCAIANVFRLNGRNELYINNHDGTFTESAAKYGLDFSGYSTQAAFFDYDHDGDLDCFLLNQSLNPVQNIVDTSNRRKFSPNTGNYLFRNDIASTGKFTNVSAAAGLYQSSLGYGLGLAVADLNNDGWDDVYVGNDFHENDYYYVNNGNGTFTESGAKYFGHYSRFSMGNDIADYNNDGQPDVVTVDMLPPDEKVLKTYGSDENPEIYQFKIINHGFQYQYSKNCLQRNNGNGQSFSEIGLLSGISATDWSWSPLFADFDNDGNKDLLISSGIYKRPVDLDYVRFISGMYMKQAMDHTDKYDDMALEKMPDGSSHPFLFKGDGNFNFTDVSEAWGTGSMKGYFNGASYADFDNDGNLDVVMNCLNAPAVVLKNKAPKKNYLTLAFKGDGMNTTGIGTKTYVFQKGKLQYQQLMLTRGFQSSSDTRLHFGLDSSSNVDSLLIIWPDQKFQLIKNIQANRQLVINKDEAAGSFDYNEWFRQTPDAFTSLGDQINIDWQHRENNFVDFNIQYLIPHAESTRGPKIATGDINGDGLEDFYVCGATGQPGALMIQQSNGSYTKSDTAVFNADANAEDVDAAIFDADGDGAADLYVVSGGNEFAGNNVSLADRLYLNNGKGHLLKSSNSLPRIFANKSCVAVADVDKDGDSDLFIGTLANSRAYGIPQTSYLLMNDGKGHFTPASESVIALQNIGMVTAANFADANKDGLEDLIIAGEWMPITVFLNKKGSFQKSIISGSTGWWQTLFADDVNNDGQIDLLAGNWGWNNKLHAGKNGPVKLYVADFDRNGQTDQLMSYTLNGEEYPFLAKDEVERPLPVLKKHYLFYSEYAGVPMKDVFTGWLDTLPPLTAERLGSAVCYGNGTGGFTIEDLPETLQEAPIFSFQKNGASRNANQYLAGGNFFEVTPYDGRYDAQPLVLFQVDKNNAVTNIPQSNLSALKMQIRDLKWLHNAKYGEILVAAPNNNRLMFFTASKPTNSLAGH